MINFLWEIYDEPGMLTIPFLIALPHLLSFFLGLFYKKFRFKKLWLGLWIVIFSALVCGYVFLVYRVVNKDFDSLLVLFFAAMFLYVFFFVVYGFWGQVFNIRKKWHWLSVPFVVVIPFFIFIILSIGYPYGEISDEPLEQENLAASLDADYEMYLSESDAWGNDSKTVSFREKNDSVYFRFSYSMCAKAEYDSAKHAFIIRRGDGASGKWTLLDSEKSAVVRKLKKNVENYSQEYSTSRVFDGDESSVVLKDYKRKTQRRLYFPNAKISHVYDAVTIEKTFESFIPPRETYTTLSYEEVSRKCSEPVNVLVEEAVHGQFPVRETTFFP